MKNLPDSIARLEFGDGKKVIRPILIELNIEGYGLTQYLTKEDFEANLKKPQYLKGVTYSYRELECYPGRVVNVSCPKYRLSYTFKDELFVKEFSTDKHELMLCHIRDLVSNSETKLTELKVEVLK